MNHYTRFFNILVVLLSLFSFDCLAQNNDIAITQQPTYELVCAGEDTNLSVEVNGADLTYQWQVNTGERFVNIDNVVWYMRNPIVYVDGAIKMMNNRQISSEPKNGSCEGK
jgi:hypothetical protein